MIDMRKDAGFNHSFGSDPRNFYRSFQTRITKAGAPRIPLHGTRHTSASLLVDLDVHLA